LHANDCPNLNPSKPLSQHSYSAPAAEDDLWWGILKRQLIQAGGNTPLTTRTTCHSRLLATIQPIHAAAWFQVLTQSQRVTLQSLTELQSNTFKKWYYNECTPAAEDDLWWCILKCQFIQAGATTPLTAPTTCNSRLLTTIQPGCNAAWIQCRSKVNKPKVQ
jgi:hypothetical protein